MVTFTRHFFYFSRGWFVITRIPIPLLYNKLNSILRGVVGDSHPSEWDRERAECWFIGGNSAETNLDQEKNPHSFVREIYCEPLVIKDYNGIDGKIGTNKRENEFISRNAGEKRILFNYVNPVLYRVMVLCKSVRKLHFPGLLCGVSAEKWYM